MKSVLALSVVLVPALAATPLGRTVFARQQASCSDIGEKPCGDGCVPLTYTCCPDKKGGCPVTSVCQLADNGVYGCCPIGRTCSGDATATTNTIDVTKTNTNTVTNTLTETQPTETQPTETLPTETQPTETESETPSATLPGTVTSVPVPTGNGTAPPATTSLPPVTAGAASNGLPAVGGLLAGVVAFLF
ncbi:60S ribosomal protein L40 [Purpureocillium lavendulum]|uniref:60S ribosomal protein L40 n=1 Tax=Purpureocillium lavendulum TaxID=1247861 RepID=A0AB34G5T7_9HYPO|nr:60S ribosomal protein L40 [Purpureocillium lavendulum]